MQTLESLNMSLTVLKSLLSDAAMRANQAEALVGKLMAEKLSPEQFQALAKTVSEQMEVRSKERAVHQQALIQATIISLESASRGDEANLKSTVNSVTKQLTMAQSHMNPQSKPVNGSQAKPI